MNTMAGDSPDPADVRRRVPSWNGFWGRRTSVQRVELYTKVSLYGVAWWVAGSYLFSVLISRSSDALSTGHMAVLIVLTVALTVVSTYALRLGMVSPSGLAPDDPAVRRVLMTGGVLVLVALVVTAVWPQPEAFVLLPMVFFSMAWIFGATENRVMYLVLALVIVICLIAVGAQWAGLLICLGVFVFLMLTLRMSLWVVRVVRELDEARGVQAELAVAEERLRFSRDVHDVMGRHLSTIAVRSELAARLVERDGARATEEMMNVNAVAKDALREARALARGYRETNLTSELHGARSLLAAAGIELDSDLESVPHRWHEPIGWIIREAVTNVLRHAVAHRVTITWRADTTSHTGTLAIRNDGVHSTGAEDGGGSGIAGLRERLTPLGADVEVSRESDTFTLMARFPLPEPTEMI